MPREAISPRKRFGIFKRDGFRCRYCGLGFREGILVVDHIRPVSDGGTNRITNLATACSSCNAGKGDTALPEAFLMRLVAVNALYEDRARATPLYPGWTADQVIAQWEHFDECTLEADAETAGVPLERWRTMSVEEWETYDV